MAEQDRISRIYKKAQDKRILSPEMTEDAFRSSMANGNDRKGFYDFAKQNGMNFPEFGEFEKLLAHPELDYDAAVNYQEQSSTPDHPTASAPMQPTNPSVAANPAPTTEAEYQANLKKQWQVDPTLEELNSPFDDKAKQRLQMQMRMDAMQRGVNDIQQRVDNAPDAKVSLYPSKDQIANAMEDIERKRMPEVRKHSIAQNMLNETSDALGEAQRTDRENWMAQGQGMTATQQSYLANSYKMNPYLDAANRILFGAEVRMKDAKRQNGISAKNIGSGLVSFAGDAGRHFLTKLEGMASFGMSDLNDAVYQRDVLKKVADADAFDDPSKVLSKEENVLYDSIITNIAVEIARENDTSRWSKAGQITADMIPFVEDIMLGSSLFKGFGNAGRKAITKGVEKHVKNKLGKWLLTNVGDVAMSSGESAATAAILPHTYANMLNNSVQVDQDKLGMDGDFRMKLGGVDEQNMGKSFGQAYGDQFLELFTETGGNFRLLGRALVDNPVGQKILKTPFGNILKRFEKAEGGVGSRLASMTMYHGVLGEWLEELEGAIYKGELKDFFTADTQLPMLLSFAVPASLTGGLNAAQQSIFENKYNKAGKTIDRLINQSNYDGSDKNTLKGQMLATLYQTDLEDLPKTIGMFVEQVYPEQYRELMNGGKEKGNPAAELAYAFKEYLSSGTVLTAFDPNNTAEQIADVAAHREQLRNNANEQATAIVEGITNKTNNYVYRVGVQGREGATGYAVSGDIIVDVNQTDGSIKATGNDVVTVKFDDGHVEQMQASELTILEAPVMAQERIQAESARLFAKYANEETYQVGDKVYLTQNGQLMSGESSTITGIDDEGIHVEIEDANGQPNETVIPHEIAAEQLAKTPGDTEEQIDTFTLPDGTTKRLYREDGFWSEIDDPSTMYTPTELENMGWTKAEQQVQEPQADDNTDAPQSNSPSYPVDQETGNPAWGQMDVEQSASALVEVYQGDKQGAKGYADDMLKEAQKMQSKLDKQQSHSLNLSERLQEEAAIKEQRAAIDAEVNKWQNIKLAIASIKTEEERQAEEAQRQKMMQAREERSKTEEGTKANASMAERYAAAPKIIGNEGTITLPDGRELKGRYILTTPDAATASHDARKNFAISSGYPVTEDGQSINDRDYTNDPEEQQKVIGIATNYNGNAIKNMPVVSDEGLVYNGNGRWMAGQLAAANGTDGAYTQSLMNNAGQFGFTAEQVQSIPNARVAFQLDERLPYNTSSLAIFNEQETQTQSNTGKAAAYARKLTPQAVSDIIDAISGFGTRDAFFNDNKAPFELINRLIADGIIGEREKAEMVDGDKLSALGRERLENIMLGTVFSNETIRLMGDDAGLKSSILRALPHIIENKSLGEYSLESDINDAIRLLYEVRNSKMPFRAFVSQTVISEDGQVRTAAENYTPFQLLLAEEMTDGGVDAFRDVLTSYNTEAKQVQGGQVDIFGSLTSTDELKQLVLNSYGKKESTNEGANTGSQTQPAAPGSQQSNGQVENALGMSPATQTEGAAENSKIKEITPTVENMLDNVSKAPENLHDSYVQDVLEYIQDQLGVDDKESRRIFDIIHDVWFNKRWEFDKNGNAHRRDDNQSAQLAQAEAETDTNPTEAQKKAGNYKMGHVKLFGFDVTVENPAGSVRRGTDPDGKEWEQTMNNTYGYIRGTEGVDGDHIDVFIGPNLQSDKVFIVDQLDTKTREFDEHKCMLGFDSIEEAQTAYLSNYEEGWTGMGTVTETTLDEFRKWIDSSHRKTKPFNEYKSVKVDAAQSAPAEVPQTPLEAAKANKAKSESNAYGSKNSLVTNERYEELKARMRKKLTGQLNMGVDPDILAIGTEMAVYHIEAGAHKFIDFAQRMIADLGDTIRPYLKAFYNGARDLPEMVAHKNKMDLYNVVSDIDVDAITIEQEQPQQQTKQENPVLQSYRQIKEQYPDAAVLFRAGDFYEIYEEDADEFADILNITVTNRNGMRMAGFPFHALDTYLPKIIRAGKRVAIADGIEKPKIQEVVTPGNQLNQPKKQSKFKKDDIVYYPYNNGLARLGISKVNADGTYNLSGDASNLDVNLMNIPEDKLMTANDSDKLRDFFIKQFSEHLAETKIDKVFAKDLLLSVEKEIDKLKYDVWKNNGGTDVQLVEAIRLNAYYEAISNYLNPEQDNNSAPQSEENGAEILNNEEKSVSLQSNLASNGQEQTGEDNTVGRGNGIGVRNASEGRPSSVGRTVDIQSDREWLSSQSLGDLRDGSKNKQEEYVSELLINHAKETGSYLDRKGVASIGEKYNGKTGESEVYIDAKNNRVVKIKDPFAKSAIKGSSPLRILDELQLHNVLFENTPYTLWGYTDDGLGNVRLVLTQPFIDNTFENATQSEIDEYLSKLGFKKDGYVYRNGDGVIVTDVTGDNVLKDSNSGELYFIDPLIGVTDEYNPQKRLTIGTITKSKDTRDGSDIWLVNTDSRVSAEEFKDLKRRAKDNNGYWSSFSKNKGFLFKTEEDANNFNNITEDEQTTDETAANTRAIGDEGTACESEVETAISHADEQGRAVEAEVANPIITHIDETVEKANEQLMLIGYYEMDEGDFAETGVTKSATRKAVKDVTRVAKQLAKDLGVDATVKATANIAPAGGDLTFRIPLQEGRELYVTIPVNPIYSQSQGAYGDLEIPRSENTFDVLQTILYRVENPSTNGADKYGTNHFVETTTSYDNFLRLVKLECRNYLPNDKPVVIQEGESPIEYAQRAVKEKKQKQDQAKEERKKDKKAIQADQLMGDLFADVVEDVKQVEQAQTQTQLDEHHEQVMANNHRGLSVGDKVLYTPYGKDREPELVEIVDFEYDGRPVVNSFNANWISEVVDWDRISLDQTKQKNNEPSNTRVQAPDGGVRSGNGQEVQQNEPSGVDRNNSESVRNDGAGSGTVAAVDGAEQLPVNRNQHNFHNSRGKSLAPTTPKARFDANIAAIRLMRELRDGNKRPTKAQQQVLAQYSGWGGLGTFFNRYGSAEYNTLHELFNEEELHDAELSINTAYYTPTYIIDYLWDIVGKLGFKDGDILEGSAGIGNILAQMPSSISGRSGIQAVELDQTTGGILKLLYPDAKVDIDGFQDVTIKPRSKDLVITNVPFDSQLKLFDEKNKDISDRFGLIHNFCIAKNVRALREGGIGVFITTSGTLDKQRDLFQWLSEHEDTDVIGAFRLNNATFDGAPVTSDIIVVRKRINKQRSPQAIDVSSVTTERVVEYDTNPHSYYDNRSEAQKKKDTKRIAITYNKYFVDHPENMGGEMKANYEMGDTFRPEGIGLHPVDGKNQDKLLKRWVASFEEQEQAERPAIVISQSEEVKGEKVGALVVNSKGEICQVEVEDEKMVAKPIDTTNTKVAGRSKAEVLRDFHAVRDALNAVLDYQTANESDDGLKPLLTKLNTAYDSFHKKYGNFHANTKLSWLRNDIDYSSVAETEVYKQKEDAQGKKTAEVTKSDVMSKRVLKNKAEVKVDNIRDAIIMSIRENGWVNTGYIAGLLGRTTEDVAREMYDSGLVFRDPVTDAPVVKYEYLSGNILDKLDIARANNDHGQFDDNIRELERVCPATIPSHLITVSLGATWLDPSIFADYVADKTGIPAQHIHVMKVGSKWDIDFSQGEGTATNQSNGVHSSKLNVTIPVSKLLQAAINNQSVTVSKTEKINGESHTESDKEATQVCSTRIDQLKDEFQQWFRDKMQADPERAAAIEETYNRLFNQYVPMRVSKEFIPTHFEGATEGVKLNEWQAQAAVRATMQPIMLAHEVGSGKTFTMITAAMEMRRLGTAKKPMIVVQNATVKQFVSEANRLYPRAKVLYMTDKDTGVDGRMAFYRKMKYNDWDMIIIPQSVFNTIPESIERKEQYIQEKIDEKKRVVELMQLEKLKAAEGDYAEKRALDMKIKGLEKEIEKIQEDFEAEREARLLASLDSGIKTAKQREKEAKKSAEDRAKMIEKAKKQLSRKTDNIESFDDMDVDALFIDEAHEYKRLGFESMTGWGIKGIDKASSGRAVSLWCKMQTIFDRTGHKNVVFATGTPISNTAAEVWTFMKYLIPKADMQKHHVYYFDDFVHNFGKIIQRPEFKTDGKFKEVTRFAEYNNVPELVRLWTSCSDTVLSPEKLREMQPDTEAGAKNATDIFLPQTRTLRSVMKWVREQLEAFDKMSGQEKKENTDIPLRMYGIASAAAIDPRLVVDAPDEPNSKTNAAVREILRALDDSKPYNGTVAIFSDKFRNSSTGFNLFEDIRQKLISAGVPENQIAVISSQSKDQKQKIFDKVNAGEIRVILGSTQKLGVGVNIQERLFAEIHLDAPNRPMDYQQRVGRIIRQGNLHKEWGIPVRLIRFGVEDSLDVTAYQRLKTKTSFSDTVMKFANDMNLDSQVVDGQVNRSMEEDEDAGQFDNMIAQISGSEYAMLISNAERKLRKLEAEKKQFEDNQVWLEKTTCQARYSIGALTDNMAKLQKRLDTLRKYFADGKVKSVKVAGKAITSDKAAEEIYKTINERIDKIIKGHNTHGFDFRTDKGKEVASFDFELDGMKGTIGVQVRTTVDGTDYITKRALTVTIPELDIDHEPTRKPSVKTSIEHIIENIVPGTAIERELKDEEYAINKLQSDIASYEQKSKETFTKDDEIRKLQDNLSELNEKMKEEMAAKQAKYAEMDADVEAINVDAEKIDLSEDEDMDDAEKQISTGDYSEYSQLVNDALDEALDKAGIEVVRVEDSDVQKELDNSARLMLEIEQGTKALSSYPIAGAKLQKNLETTKNKYKKNENSSRTAIKDIAKSVEAVNSGNSYYVSIEAQNGVVFTLRISNHNATVSNFDANNEQNGISIVISRHDNNGIVNNGSAHLVEFFYPDKELNNAPGTPIADIIGALEQMLYSGEYTDPTGIATRQEVNANFMPQDAEFSIRNMDAEYLQAVKDGDMEKARKMVLDAAKIAMPDTKVVDKNGNPLVVYHGTDTEIEVFDKNALKVNNTVGDPTGFYFTDDRMSAFNYANATRKKHLNQSRARVFPVFLNIVNPVDATEAEIKNRRKPYEKRKTYSDVKRSIYATFNPNVNDGYMVINPNNASEFVAINPSQIKSAETITFDNEGNVIPLSERFNMGNDDIRYWRTPNGIVYGWAKDGKIYLTEDGLNPNTKIHEYTHLWAKAMQQRNPEGWQSVVDNFKGTPMWDEVVNDPNYQNLQNDDDICSEALARFSGSRGAERMQEIADEMHDEAKQSGSLNQVARASALLQRVKKALSNFWKWVSQDLFGIKKFTSPEEVADRVLYDLVSSTELGEVSGENAEMQVVDPERDKLVREWNDAHPYPQYYMNEGFDHYQMRLNKWNDEHKRFQAQLKARALERKKQEEEPVAAAHATPVIPPMVKGERPERVDGETPREYAQRLKAWFELKQEEQLTADYVGEINRQADAAAKHIKMNGLKRAWLDAAKPIEDFQEWMVARGAKINGNSNAYQDTFLATGRVSTNSEALTRDLIRPLAQQIGKIIAVDKETGKSRLADIALEWRNMDVKGSGAPKLDGKQLTPREIIGVYAQAKDCEEAEQKGLPDRGAAGFVKSLGVTYKEVIDAVEAVIPSSELNAMWDLIRKSTKFALDYDFQSGRITEDTYKEFSNREYYVPQRGWRERDMSGIISEYEPVGKLGNDPYNAALVKARGRQTLASDPFPYIMSIDASSIISSENNKIKQKFLQFCLDNEELGLKTGAFRIKKFWLMHMLDKDGNVMKDENGQPMYDISYSAPSEEDLKHDKAVQEKIRATRRDLSKVKKAYEQNKGKIGPQLEQAYEAKIAKLEKDIEDLENTMRVAWTIPNSMIEQRTKDEKKQHEVVVLKDGERYIIELQDEKLANAINKKFKQHQEELFSTASKMRNATRFLSAMLTQYNPEFAASNFARDYQVALATLTAEHKDLVAPFIKNFAACQPAVWQYAWNDKVRDREQYADTEIGRYLKEYFESGAPTGFSYMKDLNTLRDDFDKLITEKDWKRGMRGAIGVFSMLTEVSETAVRFAGYVSARQTGMSINDAAYLSKELTTNFDRAGEVADSGWMSWFSFFRATLNGNIKFLKALKKMPLAYSIIAVSYFAMGILNQLLNPNDPDDEVWASDFVRESNFVFGKIRIPTAHFLRMFFAAGVNAAMWMQGNKSFGHSVYDTSTFVTNEMLPSYLNIVGNATEWNNRKGQVDFTWEGLLQGLIPSPAAPVADVFFNRDFMGATINREPFAKSESDTKDILLSKDKTLPVYKWLMQAVYETMGGDMKAKYKSDDPAWRSWLFDNSASSVEHIVEGYVPAGADMFITLGEAIYDAATGTPTSPDKWPFVRKFYNAYTPERAYNQQYYLLNSRVSSFEKDLKDYQKNDRDKYRELMSSPLYQSYRTAERLVRKKNENPTAEDVKRLMEVNKQWTKDE